MWLCIMCFVSCAIAHEKRRESRPLGFNTVLWQERWACVVFVQQHSFSSSPSFLNLCSMSTSVHPVLPLPPLFLSPPLLSPWPPSFSVFLPCSGFPRTPPSSSRACLCAHPLNLFPFSRHGRPPTTTGSTAPHGMYRHGRTPGRQGQLQGRPRGRRRARQNPAQQGRPQRAGGGRSPRG
jgi:hypothetical protein